MKSTPSIKKASKALGIAPLLLCAAVFACGPEQDKVSASPVSEKQVESTTAVVAPGVYRLDDNVVAFKLAEHPELTSKLGKLFPEHASDLSKYVLVVEPQTEPAKASASLALGRLPDVGPTRIDTSLPRSLEGSEGIRIGETRQDLSPTQPLSEPESPMTPPSTGLRRSPGMSDLQDITVVQRAFTAQRGGMHRSPATSSLARIARDVESGEPLSPGGISAEFAEQYRAAVRGTPPQHIQLSLLDLESP